MRAEEPGLSRRSRFFVMVPDNGCAVSGMTVECLRRGYGAQPPSVVRFGPLTRNTE